MDSVDTIPLVRAHADAGRIHRLLASLRERVANMERGNHDLTEALVNLKVCEDILGDAVRDLQRCLPAETKQ